MRQLGNKVLVTYDSRLGSTEEAAAFIGEVLSEDGASVDVRKLSQVDDLRAYDRVVIGSAIRYDRWLLRIPMKPDGVSDYEVGQRSDHEVGRDSDLMPDSRGFISSGHLDHLLVLFFGQA